MSTVSLSEVLTGLVPESLRPLIARLIKFMITGALGTVTNIALFFLTADLLGLNHLVCNVGCFFIACTQNYVLNALWTFRHLATQPSPQPSLGHPPAAKTDPTSLTKKIPEPTAHALSLQGWGKFVLSALVAYALNLTVYLALTALWDWSYKTIPLCVGIIAGLTVNFLLADRVVFRR